MDHIENLIKTLSEMDGVPGFEQEVHAKMIEFLQPNAEEILKDRLGSVVGKKTGLADGPRGLVAGHLDEVGWMVTQITDQGYLKVQSLGGWWTHVMLAQRVKIKTRKGDVIGVFGSKPPHVLTPEERSKVTNIRDMFIDIGASSVAEAEELGVLPGDPVIPLSDFFTMKNKELWAGKAIDNRSGCALAIKVLHRLQGVDHPNVVFSGATAQEEVGTRGAVTLANLVQPDVAIAVDVGLAYDTPGLDEINLNCKIGGGPLTFLKDETMIPNIGLRNLLFDTAKELGIHLQFDTLIGGGTDGARFHTQGVGCPTIVIGFATRYMHSHTTIMSRKDFEQALELVMALIQKLDRQTVEALTN